MADPARNRQCCTTGSRRGFCLWGTCFAGPCGGPTCNDETCPDGCCDAAAQCHVNDADACGTGGEMCAPCDVAGEVCQGGDCVCQSGVICSVSGCCPNATDVCKDDDECCAKTTCAEQNAQCGLIPNGCGTGTLDCGPCNASGTTPICDQNVCRGCAASRPCPSGCCATDGRCQDGTGDGACGAIGGACSDCGVGRRCVNRQCVCDSTSCPNGCCDAQGQCQVNNAFACGSGGGARALSCADDEARASGACLSCAAACPGCVQCLRHLDGQTTCSGGSAGVSCGTSPCTSSSTCAGGRFCAVSATFISNGETRQLGPTTCGLPAGSGVCFIGSVC